MAPKPKQLSTYGSTDMDSDLSPTYSTDCDPETRSLLTNSSFQTRQTSWWRKYLYAAVAVVVVLVSVLLILHSPKSIKKSSFHLVPPSSLGLLTTRHRAEDASPSRIWGKLASSENQSIPLPTNSWYLNLLSHKAAVAPDDSTSLYTVPYSIDTAIPTTAVMSAGIRVHWPVLQAGTRNIQMVDDFKNSLSLGAADAVSSNYTVHPDYHLSELALSLQWKGSSSQDDTTSMVSHLVRGMPFATMHYYGNVSPTIYSYNGPASAIEIDNNNVSSSNEQLNCDIGKPGAGVQVKSELKLHFIHSDFTWIVFFSRPVVVQCQVSSNEVDTRDFQLMIVKTSRDENDTVSSPLTVRVALLNQCTTGKSDIQQHCVAENEWQNQTDWKQSYEQLLRASAGVYPTSPQIDFSYPSSSDIRTANISIDWAAVQTTDMSDEENGPEQQQLLMFALPHHQESLDTNSVEIMKQCINTFHGPTCLVRGDKWVLRQDLGPPMSFTAPRPPEAKTIPLLAKTLASDIHYRLSDNTLRGASDTYFSGKILARLARVIVIADELQQLAAGKSVEYLYDEQQGLAKAQVAAASVDLPSSDDIAKAVDQLKRGVQIWLSGAGEAPFVYDEAWGGLVNCGCRYVGKDEHGFCNNTFPDCPALIDVNEDFGNGYYNDHHYHLGYHLYAAAVVAKFDSKWGQEYFERVMIYIRDFANPFKDEFFPRFRQKDWFLGSSWASGIVSAENSPHGRNEESSSEAIAAYEAVALYGSVMVDIFTKSQSYEQVQTAEAIRNAGELLTSSELDATSRYWHVWSSDNHTNTYPAAYQQPVVGMLYETMASFQTWFAPEAVVSYGIQLMPLTPVAERRDDPEWAMVLYPLYTASCTDAGDFCVDNGWSVLQAGLLATTGNRDEALEQALAIPAKVFDSQGGLGNSLTNTIWYISTRKVVSSLH